jgi:hypothetical protein
MVAFECPVVVTGLFRGRHPSRSSICDLLPLIMFLLLPEGSWIFPPHQPVILKPRHHSPFVYADDVGLKCVSTQPSFLRAISTEQLLGFEALMRRPQNVLGPFVLQAPHPHALHRSRRAVRHGFGFVGMTSTCAGHRAGPAVGRSGLGELK